MRGNYLIRSLALVALLGFAGCDESRPVSPAPVLNLGIHADSATGAIIIGEKDSLWNISKRYRLPVRDIIGVNNLSPPYALAEGQRLKLPAPVDYRVRDRDTLQSIASMFGVSVSQLVKTNNLCAPYAVSPGMNLRISSSYPHKNTLAPTAARRERKMVNAVKAVLLPLFPSGVSKRSDFIWPVRGKIISPYGEKEGGLYNDGINIAAPKGTPVAAAAEGVVAYVGHDLRSYGNLVLIRHAGGMMTAYAHLGSVAVKKGMALRKGQPIGIIGATGSVSAAQLHFEIRQGSKTFDPKLYLG